MRWMMTALTSVALILTACAQRPAGPQIKVEDAWARPVSAVGDNGAIYLRLVNTGNEADALLGGESTVAKAVELHETMEMQGDVMSMGPVSSVEVPARGEVELKPGGIHLMLVELKQPLAVGDKVSITLRLEKSGEMPLDVEVREP